MIGIKDGNGDLVSIANKSDKWAVYATKAAAEDALINGELAEGMIVGVTEKPGVISEGSSVITSASATLPIVASGPEVEFYSYTNTTNSEVDFYASYYNDASQSDYYDGFFAVLNGTTVVRTGHFDVQYSTSFLYVHLRPGDNVILKGKRTSSSYAATVYINISTPTLEYHTDKLYAIEPNYSITEVNTGKKWIDGKPIYRRVLTLSSSLSFAGTTWNNTNIDMTGVDTLINFMFISNSCAMNGFYTRITSNKLQVYTLANVTTGVTGPIVLEYTKTE